MIVKEGRTDSYVCSLDPLSCVDMEILQAIRKSISVSNKNAPRVYTKYGSSYVAKRRVTVKGRKPIEKKLVNINHYWKEPVYRLRAHTPFGDIVGGIANASEYDVYIHEDRRDWEYA